MKRLPPSGYTEEFRYSVIRMICCGLPGPSACVAPNCKCYEQHGKPIFEELCKMFETRERT